MKAFKTKYLFILIVLGGLVWMVKDSFTQPGIKNLKGDFKQTAFYRNENNTGPVIRIYSVSVSDTLFTDMIAYGNLMPHTKYGTTTVYFFKNTLPFPNTLSGNTPHFNPVFKPNCIGVYEKNGMSKVSFSRAVD